MRIASTQFHTSMENTLQSINGKLADLSQQMASNKRLRLPSDDSIATVRLLRLGRAEAMITQYHDNIQALQSRLSLNEIHLDSISQGMLEGYRLLLETASGAQSVEDLRARSASLISLRDSLLYESNVRNDEGYYLFSGTLSTTPALAEDKGLESGKRYHFSGNTAKQQVVVGNGVTQAANATLENMAEVLNHLDIAIATLEDPKLAATDPTVGVVLRNAADVINSAHKIIGRKIAEIGGAQNSLQMLSDTHVNVSLSNQNNIAALSELDYPQAFISMNTYRLSLQASYKAYGMVSKLTLFDTL